MPAAPANPLRAYARVVVEVGLNLRPGQRLLLAEPYELQGVSREAADLVKEVAACARGAGASQVDAIWGDEAGLRRIYERNDRRAFERLVQRTVGQMAVAMEHGDALLFLESSHPTLLQGIPADRLVDWRALAWSRFGVVAGPLARGATNWTVAAAPTGPWADAVYPEAAPDARLPALWTALSTACGLAEPDPVATWRRHLTDLERRRVELNARPPARIRYRGPGTDLTVALPAGHRWCTAAMTTADGRPFVANLPTREVFTLPHRDSTEGSVRVARPVGHGGGVIDGIELEFQRGRVVRASARSGGDLLERLLATDEGAARLGEVAWVPDVAAPETGRRAFFHPLLDENAGNHLALGQAYPGTFPRADRLPPRQLDAAGFNRSLLHVDLPVDAVMDLIPGD